MAVKDLYTILNVAPTATVAEIKKAYRKLALQYHPDKNRDSEHATERFQEIKSAYETLMDTTKRNRYNQDQWKRQQGASKPPTAANDPTEILQKATLLAMEVNTMDIFRMNQEALFVQVSQILSAHNLAILQRFNQQATNKKIVETVMATARPLKLQHIQQLEPELVKAAGSDNETLEQIFRFIKRKKRQAFWAKHNGWIILLATILCCMLIFLLGR